MSENPYDFPAEMETGGNVKEMLLKYLRYWPWFLGSLLLALIGAYIYLRYAPVEYYSRAKIKILKEEEAIPQIGFSSGMGGQYVNLENEVEILQSVRLNRQVVDSLHLDIEYYEVGDIKTTQIWQAPFVVEKRVAEEGLTGAQAFEVTLEEGFFLITDARERQFQVPYINPDSSFYGLPFRIRMAEDAAEMRFEENTFRIVIKTVEQATHQLASQVLAWRTEKGPESISLGLFGQSIERSEAILNTLIDKFDKDGVLDRQQVFDRTIEFIEDRLIYLSKDLEDIEIGKRNFMRVNELASIESDASLVLQRKTAIESEETQLETQISLVQWLQEKLETYAIDSLLPADIGLQDLNLNTLIAGYNALVLEREALLPNMGEKNPALSGLNLQLERRRENLLNSLKLYEAKLEETLSQLQDRQAEISGIYAQIPEEERLLRGIERQQSLKENLFLVLLQKKEEAAINKAATAPSIKVVDYALTSREPTSPKPLNAYGIAVLGGLFIPFGVLFLMFSLDNKIRTRSQLEIALPDIPLVSEVPNIPDGEREENKRSELAESFRILSTNVKFLLRGKGKDTGNVIMVTSSVKGEGKTLLATELARAYASLHKKVLLVGGDLRNPRLHEYFGVDREQIGLSSFLADPGMELERCIQKPDPKTPFLSTCMSGPIPPNAPQLLAGPQYGEFLVQARSAFDFIILDTAPTLLVTDSLLMDDLSDVVLYLVRSGFTEKKLVEHIKNLQKSGKMTHLALVLNDVKRMSSDGYNYGYGYGYGGEDKKKVNWLKKVFSRGKA